MIARKRIVRSLIMIGTGVICAAAATARPADDTVYASKAGAHIDSNLLKGGGHDDTAALQRVLNRAKNGHPVRLIVDGPALVTGLDVYGNTTIECSAGAGLYLKDGSSRELLRNAHLITKESGQAIRDEHITIRGCFLNGNRNTQALPFWTRDKPFVLPKSKDGTVMRGVYFSGVNYLNIEDVILWEMRSFNLSIVNSKFINIENITIDNKMPRNFTNVSGDEQGDRFVRYANTDGIGLFSVQYVHVNGANIRTGDDAFSMGDITDATISNVVLMDALLGFRFLSPKGAVDRIVIQNVTGTVQWRFALLNNHDNPGLPGEFGSILFSDVNIKPIKVPCWDGVLKSSPHYAEWKAEAPRSMAGDWDCPLFAVAIPIKDLQLRHIVTEAVDARPLIWIGHDANVQQMSVDLSVVDPNLLATPIAMEGGHVGQLRVALDWPGIAQARDPIRKTGGTIDHLYLVAK